MGKIINYISKSTVAYNVRTANTFSSRFIGLMFKGSFGKYDGLILIPCKSIHTCFMRFPIDVVFLDKTLKIIYTLEKFKPFKLGPYIYNAYISIELPEGTISSCNLKIGDELEI